MIGSVRHFVRLPENLVVLRREFCLDLAFGISSVPVSDTLKVILMPQEPLICAVEAVLKSDA